MHTTFKIIMGWLFFIVIDCLIVFAIGEVWIRAFIPVKNIQYVSDPKIGVRLRPNQVTCGYAEKGYSNILRTNSLGLHDIECPLIKPEAAFRIQIYGDSMILGAGVPVNKTLPAQSEKYLNQNGQRANYEVYNMAPGDDGTSSQFMMYQEIGRKMAPDIVITYFMDDFSDNLLEVHGRTYSPYHQVNEKGDLIYIAPIPKDTDKLFEQFKQASRLYRLLANKFLESKFYYELQRQMNNLLINVPIITSQEKSQTTNEQSYLEWRRDLCVKKSWPSTLQLIRHFNDEVRKNGAEFILVDGNIFGESAVGTVFSNRDLEDFCKKNHIRYIPVYQKHLELEKSKDNSKFFLKDHHLNVLGNQIMSEYLVSSIQPILQKLSLRKTGCNTSRSHSKSKKYE